MFTNTQLTLLIYISPDDCRFQDSDFSGSDFGSVGATSYELCLALCQSNSLCKSLSWMGNDANCFPKHKEFTAEESSVQVGTISANMECYDTAKGTIHFPSKLQYNILFCIIV